jgi:hypothetical protein
MDTKLNKKDTIVNIYNAFLEKLDDNDYENALLLYEKFLNYITRKGNETLMIYSAHTYANILSMHYKFLSSLSFDNNEEKTIFYEDKLSILKERYEKKKQNITKISDFIIKTSQRIARYFLDHYKVLPETVNYYLFKEKDIVKNDIYAVYDIDVKEFISTSAKILGGENQISGYPVISNILYDRVFKNVPNLKIKVNINYDVFSYSINEKNKEFITEEDYMDFYKELLKYDNTIFAFEFYLRRKDSSSAHYNTIIGQKDNDMIEIILYEPHGTLSTDVSYQETFLNLLENNTGGKILYYKNNVNIKGLQYYSDDKVGYCVYFSFLMIFIILNIRKALNKNNIFSFNLFLTNQITKTLVDKYKSEEVLEIIKSFSFYIFSEILQKPKLYNQNNPYLDTYFSYYFAKRGIPPKEILTINTNKTNADIDQRVKPKETRKIENKDPDVSYEAWEREIQKENQKRMNDPENKTKNIGEDCEKDNDCFSKYCRQDIEQNYCFPIEYKQENKNVANIKEKIGIFFKQFQNDEVKDGKVKINYYIENRKITTITDVEKYYLIVSIVPNFHNQYIKNKLKTDTPSLLMPKNTKYCSIDSKNFVIENKQMDSEQFRNYINNLNDNFYYFKNDKLFDFCFLRVNNQNYFVLEDRFPYNQEFSHNFNLIYTDIKYDNYMYFLFFFLYYMKDDISNVEILEKLINIFEKITSKTQEYYYSFALYIMKLYLNENSKIVGEKQAVKDFYTLFNLEDYE